MTIVSTNTVELYTGNGTQTEWPVAFPFLRPEDVRAVVSGTGGDRVLAYGTDYVAAALPGGGGSVTTAPGAPGMVHAGEHLTLWLDQPFTQEMDLRNTGVLDAEMLERGFDRLTLMAQQLREEVGRCVKVPMTDQSTRPDALLEGITANVGRAELAALDAQDRAASATASAVRAESSASGLDAALTGVHQLREEVLQTVADARQDVLACAAFVPIGAILDFPVNTVPAGFLVCAGQVVTRVAYPDLVTYLTGGTVAPNATLPDLRGEFRRGADLGRGVDAGRTVGSAQGDAIRNITGSLYNYIQNNASQENGALRTQVASTLNSPFGAGTAMSWSTLSIDASRQVPTASENRPRNIAVVPCIKAYHAPMSAAPVDLADALDRLDDLAAIASPNVGKFCTMKCVGGGQTIPVAGAVTVAAQGGQAVAAGESWTGPSDGSLSITIPSDGWYEIRGTFTGMAAASGHFSGFITVNGALVLHSYCYAYVYSWTTGCPECTMSLKTGDVIRMQASTGVALTSGGTGTVTLTARRVR